MNAKPRQRRRKRGATPLSVRRMTFDWVVMVLLLCSSTVGIVLFGTVRHWFAGPLMLLVFMAVALFFARPFIQPRLLAVKWPPGSVLLGCFTVYTVAMIPFSSVPYETKIEALKVASYWGAYIAWTEYGSRSGRWRTLLFIAVLLGTLVALYSIVIHLQGSRMVLNMVRHENYEMRASGTFMAPAHLGAYMGTIITLALGLVCIPAAGPILRLFSLYAVLVCFPVLFLSGSRSGWVGTLVGVGVLLVLRAWRRSVRLFGVVLIAFPLLAGALGAVLWYASPMFQERAGSAMRIEGTAAWRLHAWRDTLNMVADRPILGFGPGTYRWTYPPYQTWSGDRWLRYAHNEYVHLLAEYGWVGTLLLVAFFCWILAKALRWYFRTESATEAGLLASFLAVLCAALGHALFDFNFHVYALVHLWVMIGGVTFGVLFCNGGLQTRECGYRVWMAIGGPAVLLALWAALLSFQIGVSNALMRLAEEDLEMPDLRALDPYAPARNKFLWAMRIDPGNGWPYLENADLLRRRAFWVLDPEYKRELSAEALADYREAHARNPYNMNVVYGMGRSLYALGEEEVSLEYLRRTVEYWPSHFFYATQLGLQLREMGRTEEALFYFEKAHRAGGWADPVVRENIRDLRRALGQ